MWHLQSWAEEEEEKSDLGPGVADHADQEKLNKCDQICERGIGRNVDQDPCYCKICMWECDGEHYNYLLKEMS